MEKKEYAIIASAEAFDTLSSKLYSNPIGAIIRELSCNAYDSHKLVGKETVPFDLHIPTVDEPYFKIRDYGIGMSDDFVMDIYTTYFASTKTSNENQIGNFGLGSKTPYALVNEYNVVSYFNGKKSSYKMCKTNGYPSVEKISEEDTNEPTGLEIYFDLENNLIDKRYSIYQDFYEEAKRFFSTVLFQPNWNINLNEEELLEMAENKSYFNSNSAFLSCEKPNNIKGKYEYLDMTINVAGVVFPVEKSFIFDGDSELRSDAYCFQNPINIMADKNDVTVAPNRETLHYDEKTINFIKNKVRVLMDEKISIFRDKIANANISFRELMNSIGSGIPKDLQDAAKKLINDTFGNDCFLHFLNYRGSVSLTRENFISSYKISRLNFCKDDNIGIALLDYSGCKSQQETTVLNMLKEKNEKISSKAFKDRIMYYFNKVDKKYGLILNVKEGQEDIAKKLLGTDYNIFVYKDCVPSKSSNTSTTKRGFITSTTYIYDNYKDITTWNRYKNDPCVKDDEIALVLSGELDRFTMYFPILQEIKPNLKLVVRCVKDDSTAKNVCSMTKAKNADTWIKEVFKEHQSEVEEIIKITCLQKNIFYAIDIPYSPNLYDLSGVDVDMLKASAKTENAKKLLNNYLLVANNFDKIWKPSYYTDLINEKKYKSFDYELFPLIKCMRYNYNYNANDVSIYLKSILDYISLAESSEEYMDNVRKEIEEEKKTDNESKSA